MKRSTILIPLLAGALTLASCSDKAATAPTTAAGESGSESPTAANPPAASPTAAGSPGQECGVNPNAPAATAGIAALPGGPWEYDGESNYDPCAQLSYAVAETPGGTGSSPRQFALFHDGEYIGTTTSCAYGLTSVVGANENSVTVQYKWPRGNEANAGASGRATSTFTWADGQVFMDPPLPAEMPGSGGC